MYPLEKFDPSSSDFDIGKCIAECKEEVEEIALNFSRQNGISNNKSKFIVWNAFMQAVASYESGKGISFKAHLTNCIRIQILGAVQCE